MSLKQSIKAILPVSAWATLKRVRHVYTMRTFPARNVEHIYGGHQLIVHIGDPLGAGWYDHDWNEPGEITLLRKGRLKEGARVFDIGAHQSVVALMLARCVGPRGTVIAVEATPYDVEVSRINRDLNAADNLSVIHAAVGAESGFIDFTLDGFVHSGAVRAASVRVPAYSIDRLSELHGVPDVLFIDIEGYECEALKGATDTLSTRPDVFVEVHVGKGLERFNGSVAEVVSYFPPQEYDVFAFPAKGGDIHPFNLNSGCAREHFNLIALSKSEPV